MNKINGYKTYILCAGYLIYAGVGFMLGELSANEASQYLQLSGIGAAIRHGIG